MKKKMNRKLVLDRVNNFCDREIAEVRYKEAEEVVRKSLPEIMTSIEVADLTGREVKSIHRTIRDILQYEIDSGVITSVKRENGQVSEYLLPEVESKMLVAVIDRKYLRDVIEFWVEAKTKLKVEALLRGK